MIHELAALKLKCVHEQQEGGGASMEREKEDCVCFYFSDAIHVTLGKKLHMDI